LPSIEPKADALVKKLSQTLGDAQRFSFEARILVDHVTETGQKLQFGKSGSLLVRRPNAVMADVTGDHNQYRFYYDGAQASFLDPTANQYSTISAPNTIDATLDLLAERYGIVAPLADLLVSNPYESLCSGARAGVYVGEFEVAGKRCHHLAFRHDSVDWQIWIDADSSAPPLPRKLVITYKQLPAQPQFMATFDKWNLSADATDGMFKFQPPVNAKQVELTPLADATGPSTRPAQR
jgi:hypothetical protein